MTQCISKGFVLVFHCVHWDIEPAIEEFWHHLRTRLQAQGQELLVVSTVPLHNPELPYLGIPFHLPDFCEQRMPPQAPGELHPMVRILQSWYKLPLSHASNVHTHVVDFMSRLIDGLKPAAVLSWQGAHPLSRMVREICLARDIAWWATERGWIKDTLMLDLCDNNVLSEINRSLVTQRAMANYRASENVISELRERVRFFSSAARYPETAANTQPSLQEHLGLSRDTSVWALFTHGEPHVNALSSHVKEAHQMDAASLQKCVSQLSEILLARNSVLFVREHPFNKINGRSLNINNLSNVYLHEGNVDELINAADVGLFTLSTLQFEWALRRKPFGLLSRGMLSGKGMAPQWHEHVSASDFIDDCLDSTKWEHRYSELERRIAYLYESQLIDLHSERLEASAQELANLLAMHVGSPVEFAINGLNAFIEQEDTCV